MTRHPHDFYPTPHWCVRRLLEYVKLPTGIWLEPCVGDAAIVEAVYRAHPDPTNVLWLTNDLYHPARYQQDLTNATQVRYLREAHPEIRVCIGNPPYSNATEIAWNLVATDIAKDILLLLPLSFLGTSRRRGFLTRHTPDIYILPNRPSFAADGKVSNQEYAWFRWTRGTKGGRFYHLATTPVTERK